MAIEEKDKWYRGGRPKMKKEEKATRLVQVRFTPAEYDQLLERKAKTKARHVSDFVRKVCLDKPMRMKPVRSTYQDDVLSLVQEMRADVLRIGVSINQAARRISSTTNYDDLQREVTSLSDNMAQIDAQLRAIIATVLVGEK